MMRIQMKALFAIILSSCFLLMSGICPEPTLKTVDKIPSSFLQIKFLNVGQGDGFIILFPNGKSLLMDGGPREASEAVLNGLVEMGIEKIDYLICTHPDIDHIGGLLDIVRTVPVGQVYDSGKGYDTRAYLEYIRLIHERNIPFTIVKEGMELPFDENVCVKILNSGRGNFFNNNASIVVWLKYKEKQMLFMADVEKKVEKRICKKYQLDIDLIKIAHHGSYTSTSNKLLTCTHPAYGIISYEEGNVYGHPHQSVIKRLRKHHVQLYETPIYGDIDVQTDGKDLWIEERKMQMEMPVD